MSDFNVINKENGDFKIEKNTLGARIQANRKDLIGSLENFPRNTNKKNIDGEKKNLKDLFSATDDKKTHNE